MPEKISTLTENQFEMKPQSSPQRTKNRWEHPSSPGFEITKGGLELGTRRDRSVSPDKLVAAGGHPHTGFHSPRKGHPEKTCSNLSLSDGSKRSESKASEPGLSKEHSSGSQGRSASPPGHLSKQGKVEAVSRLEEHYSRASGSDRTTAEQLKGGKGRTGVSRKETKQKASGRSEERSPERHHEEDHLPFSDSRRHTAEDEKRKKSASGEPGSSRFKASSLSNLPLLSTEKQRWLEAQHGERHRQLPHETKEDGISKSENSSPVKKTPITPGPWRVPSTCKVTQAAGVAENRV